ncbi:13226_t:CDS:2, partial [Dentiscutata heterogama]
LKELRKAINYVVLVLLSELEWHDQLDGEYLNLILLLKLFYDATTIFSGSNYSTFNLIYPTMKLLIKKFALSDSQTEDDYTDLLFRPRKQISDQKPIYCDNKDSSKLDIKYKNEKKKDHRKAKKNISKQCNDSRFKNHYLIEPPVTSVELHNLFIDDENIKITTINIVRRLYSEEEYRQPLIEEISRDNSFVESSSILASKPTITNDLMADLYSNKESGSVNEESEIDHYIQKPIQRRKCNSLTWWRDNADKYPTLSKLA